MATAHEIFLAGLANLHGKGEGDFSHPGEALTQGTPSTAKYDEPSEKLANKPAEAPADESVDELAD